MQRLPSIFDQCWAALMLFTRLPLWRLHQVDKDAYRHAVEYWPFAGWITGGTMAGIYALALPHFATPSIPILLAITSRLLLTGALHEDGLADFCDGMGGGTSRQRILEIMKDSHIGTYGVLGLIVYFLLLYNLMAVHPLAILAADIVGKSCASYIVLLPYARKEEEAKIRLTYKPLSLTWHGLRVLLAIAPLACLWLWTGMPLRTWLLLAPCLTMEVLIWYINRKIHGYTGDCCGACFLLCELSFYIAYSIFP